MPAPQLDLIILTTWLYASSSHKRPPGSSNSRQGKEENDPEAALTHSALGMVDVPNVHATESFSSANDLSFRAPTY